MVHSRNLRIALQMQERATQHRFNEGYNDCCDPEKGALTKKPEGWDNAEWIAYCKGVETFNSDTHAIQNDADKF